MEFIEIDKFDTWHPAVRLFRVVDVETKQKQGFFYLDLHPRDGKYGHAAIFHLLKRWGDQAPVDCMLCTLPAPSADGCGAPSSTSKVAPHMSQQMNSESSKVFCSAWSNGYSQRPHSVEVVARAPFDKRLTK